MRNLRLRRSQTDNDRVVTTLLLLIAVDPEAEIAAAVKRAGKSHKRVVILWASEDDPVLAALGGDVAREIDYAYEKVVVHALDAPLAKKYGADLMKRPWATILSSQGKPVANEAARVKKLFAFLEQHEGTPSDRRAEVDEAVRLATIERRRVLLVWATKLDPATDILRNDEEIADELRYEYCPVFIRDKNPELAKTYEVDLSKRPWVTILAADGTTLVNRPLHLDLREVRELLEREEAPRPSAKEVLDEALRRARVQDRRVLLVFGSPW